MQNSSQSKIARMLAGGIASNEKRSFEVLVEPENVSKTVGYLTPSTAVVISVLLGFTAITAAVVHKRIWGRDSHSCR